MKKTIISAIIAGSVATTHAPDAEAGRYGGLGKALQDIFGSGAEGAARAGRRYCTGNQEECEQALEDTLSGALDEDNTTEANRNSNASQNSSSSPETQTAEENDDSEYENINALDQYLENYHENNSPTNE